MTITERPAPAAPLSRRLRTALDLTARELSGMARPPLFQHPRLRDIYPRYLLAMYPITVTTVPLISAALDAVVDSPDAGTPLYRALADYYRKRIPEERGHDEWLLEDMARLGIDAGEARAHPQPPVVAALIGSQYYYISHYRPVAFLGYIGALEGFPPAESTLLAAAERTGYSIDCFRTLRKHGSLDVRHRDDLNMFLDSAPLTEADARLVITNAVATCERVAQLIAAVVSENPMTILRTSR